MCLIFSSPKPPQFGEEMLLQSREGELSLVTPQTSDSAQIINYYFPSFFCLSKSFCSRSDNLFTKTLVVEHVVQYCSSKSF